MRALIAVGEKDWETVVQGAVRYLPSLEELANLSVAVDSPGRSTASTGSSSSLSAPSVASGIGLGGAQEVSGTVGSMSAGRMEEFEILLVHVVDERPHQGYDLSVRSLMGRNPRGGRQSMAAAAQGIAEELLGQARQMLMYLMHSRQSGSAPPKRASLVGGEPPGGPPEERVSGLVGNRVLTGVPEKELVNAAVDLGAEAIFAGRGGSSKGPVTVSGIIRSFRRNEPGDVDGFYLEGDQEVRMVGFPPHRAQAVQELVREGSRVEVYAERHPEHLHAFRIKDIISGTSAEAHPLPPQLKEHPPHRHLGHVARFVVDHTPCDVLLIDAI